MGIKYYLRFYLGQLKYVKEKNYAQKMKLEFYDNLAYYTFNQNKIDYFIYSTPIITANINNNFARSINNYNNQRKKNLTGFSYTKETMPELKNNMEIFETSSGEFIEQKKTGKYYIDTTEPLELPIHSM